MIIDREALYHLARSQAKDFPQEEIGTDLENKVDLTARALIALLDQTKRKHVEVKVL